MKFGSWNWKFFGVLFFLFCMHSSVWALYFLPESSLWEGGRYYNQDNVYAYVEYAVYDTKAADYHAWIDGQKDGFAPVGSGEFIYAYEIRNLGQNLDPIAVFSLLGGSSDAASGIGSHDDGQGGIAPTNDGKTFVWNFDNGTFKVDQHSAYLVFSSDKGPIAGTLKMGTLSESGKDVPVTDKTPEPATMLLLGCGAMLFVQRRRA